MEEFINWFDVGQYEGTPVSGDDDLNLWGEIGDWYEFFDESDTLEESYDGFVIDVDDVSCEETVAVPISNIAFLLVMLLMLGFVFFRSRFVRT